MDKFFISNSIKSPKDQLDYYKTVFEGLALDTFNKAAIQYPDSLFECLKSVLNIFLPTNALLIQRSYMNRTLKKPFP